MKFIFPSEFVGNIVHLSQTAYTAPDSASALGCELGQIAKSLIFYDMASQEPILIIASGAHRVDKIVVGRIIGKKIKTASPEFVQKHTGYPVGSVPPFCHKEKLTTLIDESLLKYKTVWAAAGSSTAVFAIPGNILVKITGGKIIPVC